MKHRTAFLISALIPGLILLSLILSPGLASGAGRTPAAAAQDTPNGVFVVRVYYDTLEDYRRLTSFDVFEYNNTQEKYWLAAVDAIEDSRVKIEE